MPQSSTECRFGALIPDIREFERTHWLNHLWGPKEFAEQIPLEELESIRRNFYGDRFEITRTKSGGMLLVLKRIGGDKNESQRLDAENLIKTLDIFPRLVEKYYPRNQRMCA